MGSTGLKQNLDEKSVAHSTKLEVRYLDQAKRNLSSALLYFADIGSERLFVKVPWETDNLDVTTVMRKLSLEIYGDLGNSKYVKVHSHLVRIGRTSYDGFFDLRTENNELLARVWTLLIMVDKSTMRPIPVPLDIMQPLRDVGIKPRSVCREFEFPTSKALYEWDSFVRITDCDFLGHINNTKYPLLAEEAIEIALHRGAFDFSSEIKELAASPVAAMHIEYIDQILPFTNLKISIWFDTEKAVFLLKYTCEDKLLSAICVSTKKIERDLQPKL